MYVKPAGWIHAIRIVLVCHVAKSLLVSPRCLLVQYENPVGAQ